MRALACCLLLGIAVAAPAFACEPEGSGAGDVCQASRRHFRESANEVIRSEVRDGEVLILLSSTLADALVRDLRTQRYLASHRKWIRDMWIDLDTPARFVVRVCTSERADNPRWKEAPVIAVGGVGRDGQAHIAMPDSRIRCSGRT